MRWQFIPDWHSGSRVWLRLFLSLLFIILVNFAGILPTPIAIASPISSQLAPLTFYNVLINNTLNSVALSSAVLNRVVLNRVGELPALTLADLQRLDQISRAATAAGGRGEFHTAERGWTEIITEMPTNAAAWSNRGNIRIGLNQIEAAIADYTQAIALAPDVPDPYINRGAAYEAQQNWAAALEDYNQALRLNDRDPAAYNNRGNAKAALGDWQGAIADYRTASDLEPKFSLARLNVAIAEYELGRDREALKDLQNLVRKYPQFADARAALTAVLWGTGEWGKAESNWVAVMGLDQRYEDLEWLANVRRWSPRLLQAMTNFLSLTPLTDP